MQSEWRALCAGFVMSALIAIGIFPPLHAHEANAERPHTLVHRHAHSHDDVHKAAGPVDASLSVVADGSDHDNDAVWIYVRSVERSKISVGIGGVVLSEAYPMAMVSAGLYAAIPNDDSLPHGPPRASSGSRAPPTLSV